MSYEEFSKMHGSLVKGLASIAILVFVAVFFLDLNEVAKTITQISPWYFTLAVIIIIPEHIFLAWRWYLIVHKNVQLPFKVHLRYFLISIFLNTFAPGSVGGDLYRFFALRKNSTDHWMLAGAIMRERIIGVTGFSVFFLVCYTLFVLGWRAADFSLVDPFDIGAVVLMIGLLGLFPALLISRFIVKCSYFSDKPKTTNILRIIAYGLDPGTIKWFLLMLSISMAVCFLWTFCIYLIGIKLSVISLSLWNTFLVFGMVGILTEIIRAIPITLQGIGVREGLFAYLLTIFGASFDQAFVLGAATYIAVSISVLLAGVLGFILPSSSETS
jgi:uncharacterized protein (TIRG00374 family)